ncbi:hypothetical protein EDD40_2544 [Saccharothrix texasensis]|uniref:Uncharacterized protein n=1 Tax=Saccharothrix texasensis TaxID=103734 RepID=A0A3N1H4U9_9PSEU|nr:hypothetical protein EDD40_2544 [Saccharothrix texasensis]
MGVSASALELVAAGKVCKSNTWPYPTENRRADRAP